MRLSVLLILVSFRNIKVSRLVLVCKELGISLFEY